MMRRVGISVTGLTARCPRCGGPSYGGECSTCAWQRSRYYGGPPAPAGHGVPSADHYSYEQAVRAARDRLHDAHIGANPRPLPRESPLRASTPVSPPSGVVGVPKSWPARADATLPQHVALQRIVTTLADVATIPEDLPSRISVSVRHDPRIDQLIARNHAAQVRRKAQWRRTHPKPTKYRAIQRALFAELLAGPKPATHMMQWASDNGFNWNSVQQVRRSLGIASTKQQRWNGAWVWQLHVSQTPDSP